MNIRRLVIYIIICCIVFFVGLCILVYDMSCTYGIYEINISERLAYNASVGNEWEKEYLLDGKRISSGERITVPLDTLTEKTIKVTITERDKLSDSGSEYIEISLGGNKKKISERATVTIIENNGRYKGNFAEWEITVTANFIRKTNK